MLPKIQTMFSGAYSNMAQALRLVGQDLSRRENSKDL